MKTILILCAIALTLLASTNSSFGAGSCSAKANALASSYSNAQILSVKKRGNSCIIVIRVNSSDGNPPRVITKTTSG